MRGGLLARWWWLAFGLFLFSSAIVLTYESRLGLWPWDVLHQGIAKHTPLGFGVASVVVGVVVVAAGAALGGRIGFGTVANATLVGFLIQGLISLGPVQSLGRHGLGVRVALLVAGIALAGPGTALYIGADLGAGPRDTLMLVGSQRTGVRVGAVRAAIEICALAAGIALGGTFGVGTVAFAVLVGPVVEAGFWLLARSRLAADEPSSTPIIEGE